jgi:hypothetical protein
VWGACLSGLFSGSIRPPRSRGSPRGSPASRRRSGRARPWSRIRSARSSACPPPASSSSARGSRCRRGAWPRRPPSRPRYRRRGGCRRCTHARSGRAGRGTGSGRRLPGASRCSWRSGSRPWSPASAPRRPSSGIGPRDRQDAGRAVGRGADRARCRRFRGGRAGRARDAPSRRWGPCRGRRRRGGCRRSCAG